VSHISGILLSESEAFSCSGDALMKASGDVIDALRRTTSLMQGELERSVLTTQLLGICVIQPAVLTGFTNPCL
jgi:protein transport protein SEC20